MSALLSPASIADRTMIGRWARAFISRARTARRPGHDHVDDQKVRPAHRRAATPPRRRAPSSPRSRRRRNCSARTTSRFGSSSTRRIRGEATPAGRPVVAQHAAEYRRARGSPPDPRAGVLGQGAFGSTKRQRGAERAGGMIGALGVADPRPCWMRLTWASYIWSGSSRPRNRSWASSAVAFGPTGRLVAHPLNVAVDRHERHAEAEQEQDRRRSSADPVDPGQPDARLDRRHVAQELEGVVAPLLADRGERRPGSAALSAARPPGGSPRRARSAARTRPPPSPAAPGGSPSPPQPAPGRLDRRPPPGKARRRLKATSALMSALFWVRIVRISSLVGSSRRSQTAAP